ncbi:MAG: hypothetical protein IH945_03095 [Armatimonadetes bacterium]|nr:hypothetical protein [Armatimonadota bacterium]
MGFASATVAAAVAPSLAKSSRQGPSDPPVHAGFPSQDPALVREVVLTSHFNIDRVRELVTASPALAKGSWDWGFGDWESPIGAGSHMGRHDIVQLLIEHGARPNVFTFAMMGSIESVKAAVAAQPGVQRIPGPHGITLLQHAKNGGDRAKEVADYLESLGDADLRAKSLAITDEEKAMYVGKYGFGPGEEDALIVGLNSGGSLSIRRRESFGRVLNRVEEHAFAPGGAPDVRIRFVVEDGKAVSVSVHDPHPLVTAQRVD